MPWMQDGIGYCCKLQKTQILLKSFTIKLYLEESPQFCRLKANSQLKSGNSRVSWCMAVAISSSSKPSIVTKPLCATRDTSQPEPKAIPRCIWLDNKWQQLRSGQQVQGHPNHPLVVQNRMVIFVAGFLSATDTMIRSTWNMTWEYLSQHTAAGPARKWLFAKSNLNMGGGWAMAVACRRKLTTRNLFVCLYNLCN